MGQSPRSASSYLPFTPSPFLPWHLVQSRRKISCPRLFCSAPSKPRSLNKRHSNNTQAKHCIFRIRIMAHIAFDAPRLRDSFGQNGFQFWQNVFKAQPTRRKRFNPLSRRNAVLRPSRTFLKSASDRKENVQTRVTRK